MPASFSEAVQFSEMMAKANLLPPHLRGSPSDCLAVIMQAVRWGMDAYAVGQKTSVISGKIMYEGQLCAAVLNSRGDLEEEMDYQFSGEGTNRVCVVVGQKKSWKTPRTITLTYKQAAEINKNGQMLKNPDQQMAYIGVRIWGRRYMPGLLLGVYEPGEISEAEESPPPPPQRSAVPPKAKGVNGMKNVTPPKEDEPAAPAEGKAESFEHDEPKPEEPKPEEPKNEAPKEKLLRYLMGEVIEFTAQGRTFYDCKVTGDDGVTKTVYWGGDRGALPLGGSYALLKLEEKKSAKAGAAPKTFIVEIHAE
jgi:hypothetical protein